MATIKNERLAQSVADLLAFRFGASTVTKLYNANSDVYLRLNGGSVLVKFEPVAQEANNAVNPVTGLAGTVFVPDVCRIGYNPGTQATDTVTLTSALATATVTINGSVFTAVAGAAANATQFTVAGNDAADAAALAAAVNASIDPLIVGTVSATAVGNVVTLRSVVPGVAGNRIPAVSSHASMVVATATFTGGVASPTSDAVIDYVIAACAQTHTALALYKKAGIAITDLVESNTTDLYQTLRSTWGYIDQQ